MKVVFRCLGCDHIKRLSESYQVKLTERTKNMLTGEIKEQDIVGRICRECGEIAGYKVKRGSSVPKYAPGFEPRGGASGASAGKGGEGHG